MSNLVDLTIAIPVKNEEANLLVCLNAIGNDFAKHVVVIDSNSTDQTQRIAAEWGADVVNFVWDGKFPKKRNWFLRNYNVTTKWILFLDADEIITAEFKKEVATKLAKEDKAGYWLSYCIYFLGKQLKGGYPLRKLALFKVGAGEYERIEEERWSHLDMEVHEHPVLNDDTGVIYARIDHKDFRGISNYISKHNEYASWEAGRYLNGAAMHTGNWTWRQKLKYRLMHSMLIGPAYFVGSYIFLGGFRDGARGFAFAILKMSYFTQVYCKIRESQKAA